MLEYFNCGPTPMERAAVVANYDAFTMSPTFVEAYSLMVKQLNLRFYSRVTRYGTGSFLKARLDMGRVDCLKQRREFAIWHRAEKPRQY